MAINDKRDYVISFDVRDKKRLVKLSKFLEKRAFRFQYSVFLYAQKTKKEVQTIAKQIENIIDKNQDDVRIYTIKSHGIAMGNAYDLKDPFLL